MHSAHRCVLSTTKDLSNHLKGTSQYVQQKLTYGIESADEIRSNLQIFPKVAITFVVIVNENGSGGPI